MKKQIKFDKIIINDNLNSLTSVDKDFLKGTTINGSLDLNSLKSVDRELIKNNVKYLKEGYNAEKSYCYFDGNYLSRTQTCNIHGNIVNNYIICSAIHFINTDKYQHQPKNIETGIVITGRRHHNIFTNMKSLGIDRHKFDKAIQGFLTSDDLFVDRKNGGRIAYKAKQIDKPTDCLFSEDIY